jgi:hypothetical protein
MALKASKVDVWSGEIADERGALARQLEGLARAGVDLSFLVARRQPDKPGKGIVFLTGIEGAGQIKAAKAAGLAKTTALAALRVEGPNKPGLMYEISSRIAEAGINLRGVSASVVGSRFVALLAFDSAADASKAVKFWSAG